MPQARNANELPNMATAPVNLIEAASSLDQKLASSPIEVFKPIRTGFAEIDKYFGGGLHAGDFLVLGGVQNVGKTAYALQMAGQITEDPSVLCIFVCYEHSTQNLFERLIIQHSFRSAEEKHITAETLTNAYIESILKRTEMAASSTGDSFKHLQNTIHSLPGGVRTWTDIMRKQERIWLVTGHSVYTDTEVLKAYVNMGVNYGYRRIVLFVDYIQRVPFFHPDISYVEDKVRIDFVLKDLKATALINADKGFVTPIIGVGASDEEGLRSGRVHLENLWGNSIMQYEPDLAIILNKDPEKDGNLNVVRVGIEKNRHGPSDVEWRHKHFGSAFLFEPEGSLVSDTDSFQSERKLLRMEQEARLYKKLSQENHVEGN